MLIYIIEIRHNLPDIFGASDEHRKIITLDVAGDPNPGYKKPPAVCDSKSNWGIVMYNPHTKHILSIY
jgi:hypothetical protein